MEAWAHLKMSMNYDVVASESPYAAWVSGQTYYRGDRVFSDPADGGDSNNYELVIFRRTTTTRPEDESPWYWVNIGAQQTEVLSYQTTAQPSLFSNWTSGAAVLAGEIQYDPQSNKDYAANVDVSAGDNTVHPSVAVQSNDIELAARWTEIGPANAFAMLDSEINTPTLFIEKMAAIVRAYGKANRLAFFGLRRVESITVDVEPSNIFEDDTIVNSNLSLWNTFGVEISHLNPGLRITDADGSDGFHNAYIFMYNLIPGQEYIWAVVGNGTANGSPSSWQIGVQELNFDLVGKSTPLAFGSGTSTMTFTATASGHVFSIIPAVGTTQVDVSQVILKHNVSGVTVSKDLEYGTTGRYQRSAKLEHPTIVNPQYTIEVFGPEGDVVDLGLISAGFATQVGTTQAEIRVGGQQFHSIDIDEYGNAKFVQRGRSRELTATIWMDTSTNSADLADLIMTELEGRPATYDLNDDGLDSERLLVHGWAEDWYTVVTGIPGNDYLVISPLRSLAEPGEIPQRFTLAVT